MPSKLDKYQPEVVLACLKVFFFLVAELRKRFTKRIDIDANRSSRAEWYPDAIPVNDKNLPTRFDETGRFPQYRVFLF